jgi:hypothetical protein
LFLNFENSVQIVINIILFLFIKSIYWITLHDTLFLPALSDIIEFNKYLTDRRIDMVDQSEFPNFGGDNTNDTIVPETDSAPQENNTTEVPATNDPNPNNTVDPVASAPSNPTAPPPPPAYPNFTPAGQPYQQPYNQPQYPPAPPAYPQNNFQQPPYTYQQPFNPPYMVPKKPTSGLGIASLVLGITAIVFCWIPGLNILLSLLALILGIVAKAKGDGGMAIAGIVIGAIMFIVSCIILAVVVYAINLGVDGYYEEDIYNYDWQAAFTSLTTKLKFR